MEDRLKVMESASLIVAAYVANHQVPATEIAALIADTAQALTRVVTPQAVREEPEGQTPAVSVSSSVTPDFILCLEDGKKFKSLKRHLRSRYGMSPEQYRKKWNLPADYPMVAPNYAEERSTLAKRMRLGLRQR
jgi:predicted transcriptional regulator